MKLLTKESSKKLIVSQKDIEDTEDIVIKDIHSVTATDNYVNNSITGIANDSINFFLFGKTMVVPKIMVII